MSGPIDLALVGPLSAAVDYVAAGGPFAYANLAILLGALALIGERLATVAFIGGGFPASRSRRCAQLAAWVPAAGAGAACAGCGAGVSMARR